MLRVLAWPACGWLQQQPNNLWVCWQVMVARMPVGGEGPLVCFVQAGICSGWLGPVVLTLFGGRERGAVASCIGMHTPACRHDFDSGVLPL